MPSVQVVRASKFRHVHGKADKYCYDNIRGNFCTVNPKFIGICLEATGGGSFIVLPLALSKDNEKSGRQEQDSPIVDGHSRTVVDLQFCPFNDNVIASASDDCTIKIWLIPDGGLVTKMTEPAITLEHHQKRVSQICWHPVASGILMSVGLDNEIVIWDVASGKPLIVIACHPERISSAAFNLNGSRIVTTCKDNMIRIIDARSGEIIKKGTGHEGSSARAIYLKDGRIFSTGFSKRPERQYALWDEATLGNPLTLVNVDDGTGVLIPLYNPDNNLMFLSAKGDYQIRYYEVNMEQPPYVHYIDTFLSVEHQRGLGVMPKRGCDIIANGIFTNEIFRLYRLQGGKGKVVPIRFFVPRKSDQFQEDLYPDTLDVIPALSAEQWWTEKKDANPQLISRKHIYEAAQCSNPMQPCPVPTVGTSSVSPGPSRSGGFVHESPDNAPKKLKCAGASVASSSVTHAMMQANEDESSGTDSDDHEMQGVESGSSEGDLVGSVDPDCTLPASTSTAIGGFMGDAADEPLLDERVKRKLDKLEGRQHALETALTTMLDTLLGNYLRALEVLSELKREIAGPASVSSAPVGSGTGLPETVVGGSGTAELPSWDDMVDFVNDKGKQIYREVKASCGKKRKTYLRKKEAEIGGYKLAGWLQKVAMGNLVQLKQKHSGFLDAAFWDDFISAEKGRTSNNRAACMTMDKLLLGQTPSTPERCVEGEKFVRAMYFTVLWKKSVHVSPM